MTIPTIYDIGTERYEEGIREAVAAGLVKSADLAIHIGKVAIMGQGARDFRSKAQWYRLASDLASALAQRMESPKAPSDKACYWCDAPADLIYEKSYCLKVEGDNGVGYSEGEKEVPLCAACYCDEVEVAR